MQSSPTNPCSSALPDVIMEAVSGVIDRTDSMPPTDSPMDPVAFEGHYIGQMEMAAEKAIVAHYLDVHQDWFKRCAQPMAVEPITKNGYALVIGHFGALGYEVEPKIGLHLLPQDQGVYRIETLSIPGYTPPGYDVDFRAALELLEITSERSLAAFTRVDWELHLTVKIHFPRFIHALPTPLVKASGDKLLNQIVRQVSKRLTRKVQEDFHQTLDLPLPPSYHRHRFWSGWGKSHQDEDV